MKLVYVFSKTGRLRFVSHLDLQRFLLRALNRTELDLAFSQGFNPHPLLSLAGALAMGYESEYEVFEVRINGNIEVDAALETMRQALPGEMYVKDVKLRPDNHPSMMSLVRMADYTVSFSSGMEGIRRGAEAFIAAPSVMGIRKTKSGEKEVDVRALCKGLEILENGVRARLMLTEAETLKPDLLVETLCRLGGCDVPEYRVMRNALLGTAQDGTAVPIAEL
ncbi:MAG: TIGR03936 family radical SAM-associated protein [Clostridiales bacterium]|nr:TIGR03936 family radical SAM-associated protein [Clostridiales bacterium]